VTGEKKQKLRAGALRNAKELVSGDMPIRNQPGVNAQELKQGLADVALIWKLDQISPTAATNVITAYCAQRPLTDASSDGGRA
jgi:hypothetical protein